MLSPTSAVIAEPNFTDYAPHRWTAEEYLQLGNLEIFQDRRMELIDGEIYDVASQNNPHASGLSRTGRVLFSAFDENWWVMLQSTVRLPLGDIPDPDFAVRSGPASSDISYHPLPLLIIEVSDSTLLFDQTIKAGLYAANGILDYWIVNVQDRQIEVYRNPIADPTLPAGTPLRNNQHLSAGCQNQPTLRSESVLCSGAHAPVKPSAS